jgi:outer membrane receptor protein involved in Fe transport
MAESWGVELAFDWDVPDSWRIAAVYSVDDVPYFVTPSHTRFDLHLGYNPTPDWRFSLGVQNAFDEQTPEGDQGNVGFGSEIPRAF